MKPVARGPRAACLIWLSYNNKTSCCKKCSTLCFLTVNESTESQFLATLQFTQSNFVYQYIWTVKVETASSSETSAIYQSPRCHITENLIPSQQRCDNPNIAKKAFITNTDVTDGNLEQNSKVFNVSNRNRNNEEGGIIMKAAMLTKTLKTNGFTYLGIYDRLLTKRTANV